jgi:hypothetical protein
MVFRYENELGVFIGVIPSMKLMDLIDLDQEKIDFEVELKD